MPIGLGKSKKRPEDEEAAPEENLEGSEGAPSSDEIEGGNTAVADRSAAEDQVETGKAYRAPDFRPDYLDEDAPRGSGAPAVPPPEGDAFFVSVTSDGTAQVHRFDHPSEAQAFVEQLLEKDVPEEEVAAFSGRRLSLKVSRRPVVKLSSDQED